MLVTRGSKPIRVTSHQSRVTSNESEPRATRYELHDSVFSPVAVVFTRRWTDESTMSAVRAHREGDVRVLRQPRIAKRRDGHERIVLGGDDERRHAEPIDHPHGARAMVIIVGAVETEMRRRVHLVEFPNGSD